MDSSLYSHVTVSRGFQYRYFYSVAVSGFPTLLLLHGFPAHSIDWRIQIEYFIPKGYGILAPDMLGSGETDRPNDWREFRLNRVATDIIEILDNTGLMEVVLIGHDWGSVVASRLSMLYPDRFSAYVWLGHPFIEPLIAEFDLESRMEEIKAILGYEGYAYWEFFREDNAAPKIHDNIDSFLQLLYPKDPLEWLTYMARPGKTREWIMSGKRPGIPSYLTAEDYLLVSQSILKGGIASSLNWYISQLNNNDVQDNLDIHESRWKIRSPCLMVTAAKDVLCTPAWGKAQMEKFGFEITLVELDAGHWLHHEAADELNAALEHWLGTVVRT